MKWLKRLGIVVGALAVVLAGAATYLELRPAKQRAIDATKKFEATPERLARGKYIVTARSACLLCHSEHDWTMHGAPELPGRLGAGWDVPYAENKMPGKVFAANITPDPETGLGSVSDDAIARAIREGVTHDGRPIFMMPWTYYRNFSDEEVASIVVYLRSLQPANKLREKTELIVPVRWIMKFTPQPITAAVPEPDLSTPVARGKHLAATGFCQECHTPVNERHEPLPGMEFAGGQEFHGPWGVVRTANITPHASGIAHYNEDLFIRTIRTGNIGGRRLSSVMPWAYLRNLTDEDLKALWAFLKTVKPVAHDVPRVEVKVKDNPNIPEHPPLAAAAAPAAAPGATAEPTKATTP